MISTGLMSRRSFDVVTVERLPCAATDGLRESCRRPPYAAAYGWPVLLGCALDRVRGRSTAVRRPTRRAARGLRKPVANPKDTPAVHVTFTCERYIATIDRMARRGDTIELAVLG